MLEQSNDGSISAEAALDGINQYIDFILISTTIEILGDVEQELINAITMVEEINAQTESNY